MKRIDIDQVRSYIEEQSPETKIYIGGDSERFMMNEQWYADYILLLLFTSMVTMAVRFLVKYNVNVTGIKKRTNHVCV